MLFKKCTKCHKRKTLDDFYKDKNNKTGYRNSCKKCKILKKLLPHRSFESIRSKLNRVRGIKK